MEPLPYPAKICRDLNGSPKLFKTGMGLWSDDVPDGNDDVVDIAVLVESTPNYIWKFPIRREMLNYQDLELMMTTRAAFATRSRLHPSLSSET